jgi:DNA modification methylase
MQIILPHEEYKLHHGKNEVVMPFYPENFVDSIVTDPPYGIRFMGKAWDSFDINKTFNDRNQKAKNESVRPGRKSNGFGKALFAGQYDTSLNGNIAFQLWFHERARLAYRVLKPGGYFVAFCSPRTYHRMVCAVEDAGFEIRDQISWVFAQGFPKSMDAAKAIDKHLGLKSRVVGKREHPTLKDKSKVDREAEQFHGQNGISDEWDIKESVSEESKKWRGYGTALKPAHEPILIARKPLVGSVANNLIVYGTGAINIDGTRIPGEPWKFGSQPDFRGGKYGEKGLIANGRVNDTNIEGGEFGRWPSNFIHDGSDEVMKMFPYTESGTGAIKRDSAKGHQGRTYSKESRPEGTPSIEYGDSGSAARFFYCAKISPEDRSEGLPEGMENLHPTVKPTSIMRYLVRLVTPVGGLCMDPFNGSGSTGKACAFEMVRYVGIEMEEQNIPVSDYRIKFAIKNRTGQFALSL